MRRFSRDVVDPNEYPKSAHRGISERKKGRRPKIMRDRIRRKRILGELPAPPRNALLVELLGLIG